MPTNTKIHEELKKLNVNVNNLPQGNTKILEQGNIYTNEDVSANTYSNPIDLQKSSSTEQIFRNISIFSSTTSTTEHFRIAIANGKEVDYVLLPQTSSIIRHDTSSSKYDLTLFIKDMGVRFIKIYNELQLDGLTLNFSATD